MSIAIAASCEAIPSDSSTTTKAARIASRTRANCRTVARRSAGLVQAPTQARNHLIRAGSRALPASLLDESGRNRATSHGPLRNLCERHSAARRLSGQMRAAASVCRRAGGSAAEAAT
jgi:hypothetical protein